MTAAISDRFLGRLQGPGLDYLGDQRGSINALTPCGWMIGAVRLGAESPQGAGRNLGLGVNLHWFSHGHGNFAGKQKSSNRLDSLAESTCDPLPHTQYLRLGTCTIGFLPAFPLAPCHSNPFTYCTFAHHRHHSMPSAPPPIISTTRPWGVCSEDGRSWMMRRRVRNADGLWDTTAASASLLRCLALVLAGENHHHPPQTHWWDGIHLMTFFFIKPLLPLVLV